jgi:hypothetical protein
MRATLPDVWVVGAGVHRAKLSPMRDDLRSGESIRLVLPAEPEYGRLARITVSSLAQRMGFGPRAIGDLRLAVDEAVILLLRPEGRAGRITLVFTVERSGISIDASTTAGEDQHWVDQGALAHFEAVVRDTVDAHAVDESGHHVHLVKHFT